jgi:hypothetical protein
MKKTMLLAVAVALGLAFNASAQIETKSKTEVKGDTTTTKTELKNTETGRKAKETVVSTSETTTTKQEVKGPAGKIKKETVVTPEGEAGKVTLTSKKGAFEDLKIDWTYQKEGNMFVTEYTIKEKTNKQLIKELNLNQAQANALKPGTHKIYSTSPYTGDDIRTIIRSAVLEDVAKTVKEVNAPKAK